MNEGAGVEAGKGGSQEDAALGLGGVMEIEERQWMDGFQTYFEGRVYRTHLWMRYKVSDGGRRAGDYQRGGLKVPGF